MGADALVKGSSIEGMCKQHKWMPGSSVVVKPPSAFSAPISQKTIRTVLIGGQEAAVVDSFGLNSNAPTHAGIVDPPYAGGKLAQVGTIRSGSPTVFIDGSPAATTASVATCCYALDKATGFKGAVTTVKIG